MPIASLINRERVSTSERALDPKDALAAVADLLGQPGALEALLQREQMGSTAIGHGVALPHGRNEAFDATRAAFIRLRHPLDFGAIDGVPVDLLLALSVPAHFTHQHLQLLAGIAERFSEAGLRESLRVAADAEAVYAVLTGD